VQYKKNPFTANPAPTPARTTRFLAATAPVPQRCFKRLKTSYLGTFPYKPADKPCISLVYCKLQRLEGISFCSLIGINAFHFQ
jgi:hypothetical protein